MPIFCERTRYKQMTESERSTDEVLRDISPSCNLVYRVLKKQGPLRPKEIIDDTYMSESTVYRALEELEEKGLITSFPGVDARRTHYRIVE